MELEITNCTECALCLNKCSLGATAKSYTKRRNGKNGIEGLQKNISRPADDVGLVEEQLQIIFLLRNVLDIPQKQCCDFLQVYGNPSLWIDCCDLCSDLVGMAKTIFDEIITLQRKFEKLQNQIKNKIVQTAKSEDSLGDECEWGVKETIRSFFKQGISRMKTTLAKEETIRDLSSDLDSTELISFSGTDLNSCFVENEGIDEDHSLLIQPNNSSTDYITCKPEEPMSLLDDREEEKTENVSNRDITKVSYLPVTNFNSDDDRIQNSEEDNFSVYQSGYSKCEVACNANDPEEQDPLRLDEAAEGNKDNINIKEEPSCHPVQILPNEEISSQSESDFNLNISTSSFHIRECLEDADSKSNSTNDVNIHNRTKSYKSSFSNILVDSSCLKRHEITNAGENRYECSFCGKKFTRTESVKNHERFHTGEKPYKCATCGTAFTQKKYLKRHEPIHTGEKSHKCKICGRGFLEVGKLKQHEIIHTGEKPHQCKICGAGFTQAGNLKQHELIHTGEKPYKCQICGRGFLELGILKKHEIIHTGEKPYKCEICGKGFTQSGSLKRHESIHTGEKPFKCSFCEKAFTRVSFLKNHENIHTGVKPYKCKFCERGFTQPTHLKNHESLHTHEKPYECKVCKKRFVELSRLKRHEGKHIVGE